MAVNCVAVQAFDVEYATYLSKLHFCPEYFLP